MDVCKRVKVKITNRVIGACKGYWMEYTGKLCEIVKVPTRYEVRAMSSMALNNILRY